MQNEFENCFIFHYFVVAHITVWLCFINVELGIIVSVVQQCIITSAEHTIKYVNCFVLSFMRLYSQLIISLKIKINF